MKIAFCTTDMETINQHFGKADKVAIYDIDDKGYSLSETREFVPIDPTKDHKVDTETKAQELNDCAILYVAEIGGPAAAHVIKNKIHPVKVTDPMPIVEVLDALKEKLGTNPAPWLKKAMLRDA
ncbi:MAG: nitrogen fixation protein NifX [Denitrovibrio sp.]|nr:MAG: nitrogen fixation protein NifX [Denitrovibrio sp.]